MAQENIACRETGPDFIRISACIFVILMHASASMFHNFSDNWNVCVAYNAMTRPAVPLFFMITGYFLLNKNIDNILLFYIKRLHRIIFPFVIVLVIYYIKLCVFQHSMSSTDFIIKSLTKAKLIPTGLHLWFIYTLVGVYFAIPFFSYFFSTAQGIRLMKLFLVIWCISYICFPVFVQLKLIPVNIFKSFHFDFFSGHIGYVVIGGMLSKITFKNIYRYRWISLYIFATFLVFISTYFYSHYMHKPNTLFLGGPFVVIQAVAFFVAFKDFKYKSKLLDKFAELSYWIYLIHLLILAKITTVIPVAKYSLFTIPLVVFLVVVFAFIISIPLSKFEKFFNRLVFNPCVKKLKKTITRIPAQTP